MAQIYFPFDSGQGANVTEQQWAKMAERWLGTGVISNFLNSLEVYADSTGMQVKVKSGAAWVKGHYFESDSEEVLAISQADPTNPRIDRVVVKLDWTANTIQLAVLQGVPAVSPVPAGRTQNSSRWEISLAQVRVNAAATTIAAADVTNERNFAPSSLVTASHSTTGEMFPDGVSVSEVDNASGWPHLYGTVVTTKYSNLRCHQTFYGSYQNGSQEVFHRDWYSGVGWSPWLKISSNATRVSVSRTTTLSLNPSVYTKVLTFDEEFHDNRSVMNMSTGTFTAPETGVYTVTAYANIYIESGKTAFISLYKNGSLYRHLASVDSIGSMFQQVIGFEEANLNKNDTLELYIRQTGVATQQAKGIRMMIRG